MITKQTQTYMLHTLIHYLKHLQADKYSLYLLLYSIPTTLLTPHCLHQISNLWLHQLFHLPRHHHLLLFMTTGAHSPSVTSQSMPASLPFPSVVDPLFLKILKPLAWALQSACLCHSFLNCDFVLLFKDLTWRLQAFLLSQKSLSCSLLVYQVVNVLWDRIGIIRCLIGHVAGREDHEWLAQQNRLELSHLLGFV